MNDAVGAERSSTPTVDFDARGGTWEGAAAAPVFYRGMVGEAGPFAAAMLVLGRVASTRYYTPPSVVAARRDGDPVFTSDTETLRLESFSLCAGVYARFDLDGTGVDVDEITPGVTNVDLGSNTQALLARMPAYEPMRISVAASAVALDTLDGTSVESKVRLPVRWVRSFAESQLIASTMTRATDLDALSLGRLIHGLPRTSPSNSVAWVQSTGTGIRLSSKQTVGSIGLAGPQRLRAIEPLLPHIKSVRAYSADGPESFWEFGTARGRFTLGFSATSARGFSGEGGLLEALAGPSVDTDVDRVYQQLCFSEGIVAADLASRLALSAPRVARALSVLASQGLVGFDLNRAEWFFRPLPFDATRTEKLHPRLAAANSLASAVTRQGDGSLAVGGYRVRFRKDGAASDTCTCPWWGKHRGDRGPCKHVLAARLAEDGTE